MREVDFRDLLNFRSISEMSVSWCVIVSDSNLPYPSDHAAFTMRSLASRVGGGFVKHRRIGIAHFHLKLRAAIRRNSCQDSERSDVFTGSSGAFCPQVFI